MLQNPNWDKTDIHSLSSLIAWLERQPADGRYRYASNKDCLLAQYYTEMYGQSVQVGGHGLYRINGGGHYQESPESFWRIASDFETKTGLTFGAALERAKAEKAKEKEYAI